MKKPKIRKKSVVGIALIVLAVLFFCFWESFGREMIMYPEVLVFNTDMNRGDEVNDENIAKVRIGRTSEGAITDISALSGKVVNQYIKAGEPIYPEYLIEKDMTTSDGEGKFIFSLTEDWLSSYPQSLRRGDMAYIYSNGEYLTNAKVAYVKDSENCEVTSSDKERLGASASVSAIEVIVDKNEAALISSYAEAGYKLVVMYN